MKRYLDRQLNWVKLLVLGLLIFSPGAIRADEPVFSEDQHQKLLRGEFVYFSNQLPAEKRLLRAEWLREAADKQVPIHILEAVIRGNVDWSYARFDNKVDLTNCTIEGYFDASNAVFNRDVHFAGAFNGGASFEGARFERTIRFDDFSAQSLQFSDALIKGNFQLAGIVGKGGASFERTSFHGEANFMVAVFQDQVEFDAAEFHDRALFNRASFSKYVSFERAHFWGDVQFGGLPKERQVDAHFHGLANFRFAQFENSIDFRGTSFEGDVDFFAMEALAPITFEGAIFKKNLLFQKVVASSFINFSGASFYGETDFTYARVSGGMEFLTSKDTGPCHFHGHITFYGSEVYGETNFENTVFEGDAMFAGAQFGNRTAFLAVSFRAKADFHYTRFTGITFFEAKDAKQLSFLEDADFSGASFDRPVEFKNAVFVKKATFTATIFRDALTMRNISFRQAADFSQAQFHGSTYFGKIDEQDPLENRGGVTFSEVGFDRARFENDAHFELALFNGRLSMRGTKFQNLLFSPTGQVSRNEQFNHEIDFRDATYERIQTNWHSLLRFPNEQPRQQPHDPQPYLELESALRTSGSLQEADQVYVERMNTQEQEESSAHTPQVLLVIVEVGLRLRDRATSLDNSPCCSSIRLFDVLEILCGVLGRKRFREPRTSEYAGRPRAKPTVIFSFGTSSQTAVGSHDCQNYTLLDSALTSINSPEYSSLLGMGVRSNPRAHHYGYYSPQP